MVLKRTKDLSSAIALRIFAIDTPSTFSGLDITLC
jgi:hypothetical protein